MMRPLDAREWITDHLHLLNELTDILNKAGYQGDVDDALQNVLADLECAEAELTELKAPPVVYDL